MPGGSGSIPPFERKEKHVAAPIPASSSTTSGKEELVVVVLVEKRRKEGQSQPHRKARRCWSPGAPPTIPARLKQLGGSHVATPKQIRELMEVDGLTNDEVKEPFAEIPAAQSAAEHCSSQQQQQHHQSSHSPVCGGQRHMGSTSKLHSCSTTGRCSLYSCSWSFCPCGITPVRLESAAAAEQAIGQVAHRATARERWTQRRK
ncbi:unnamed protein product [Musa acuminata subsp. burmannicoides]